MNYIGVDCSKTTFDVTIPKEKGYQTYKFDNIEIGFRKLLELLPAESQCVMEADPKCMAFGQQVQWPLFLPLSYLPLPISSSCFSSNH